MGSEMCIRDRVHRWGQEVGIIVVAGGELVIIGGTGSIAIKEGVGMSGRVDRWGPEAGTVVVAGRGLFIIGAPGVW